MKKKEIKSEEEIETTETETETEEVENEPTEEEVKAVDRLTKIFEKKVDAIRENPVSKSYNYKEEASKESVIETDPYLRKVRPFVKLSPQMENFIQNVKAVARGEINSSLTKALSEGDDSAGGFLVPSEFSSEVLRYETENSVVRPRARVWNMTRDRWSAPKLDQNTTTDSTKTGSEHFAGIQFYYPGESGLKEESQPRFGRITLVAKKLIGLTSATDELLEDSAVNLANYLVSLFGEGLGYLEDYKFLRGTGVGEPLGVINTTGITVVGRNTSTSIVLEDVLRLDENLPAWADRNAVYLTTKAGISQLRLIGNTNTTTKIQIQESLRSGEPATLLGRPVIVTDKLPALGSTGDILLGDFSKYYIGDRGGIQVASSIHDRFRYDETVFRLVKRHDGQPALPKAFVVLSQ
jgi:HK97 family phage major capsid protein